jgi:hypothetical protein
MIPQGISSNPPSTWRGRTTEKSRRLSVASCRAPRFSATVTTLASTRPNPSPRFATMVTEQLGTRRMVGVVAVSRGQQDAGVDDNAHSSRAASPSVNSVLISRCRRPRSPRPERMEPMNASSGSSPDRPAAIRSALSSSILTPSRAASAVRRLARSSGTCTIVDTPPVYGLPRSRPDRHRPPMLMVNESNPARDAQMAKAARARAPTASR